MARHVFFSFHYERDVWRASQVRNSWVTKGSGTAAGFWDHADWEKVKKKGDKAIQAWIDAQMEGSSVTVVLIGKETSDRQWVRYEVQKSHDRGKGMLGIYIHNIKDSFGRTDQMGNNHFGLLGKDSQGNDQYFWNTYQTYDWALNDGYKNLADWIETAAKNTGK